jgi:hypothetical protein
VAAVASPSFAANAKNSNFSKSTLTLTSRGTSTLQSTQVLWSPETDQDLNSSIKGFADRASPKVSQDAPPAGLTIPIVSGTNVSPAIGLGAAFPGLNHFAQRFSDGGNQFNVEPPDMGLAVGNSFVVQAVNDVMDIYDTGGNALITAASLNQFFYGEHALTRSNPPTFAPFGHSITDPTVYFDHDTQRWFITVLTFDTNPATGGLVGTDHLDIAVSTSGDPTGPWVLYQIDVTGDGVGCDASTNPCFGDFPHVGADAHGFYITTNSFPFFGGFAGAQIYALSKSALAANSSVSGIHYTTLFYDTGDFTFSVMPAITPTALQYNLDSGGTEFFMAALDAGAIFDNRIAVWGMVNTSALDTDPLQTALAAAVLPVETYGDPLRSLQKAGDYPQGQSFGQPEGQINNNDSRITQCVYANGKLFGSNTSRLQIGSDPTARAGAAYYIVKPRMGANSLSGTLWTQGYVAVAGNNLSFPSIGVTPSGKGIMTFTLVGPDYFPSSAYSVIDKVKGTPGDVRIAGTGVGPQDGFSEYPAVFGGRPRWGDYSATTFDGNSVWWANQYINQTCTLAQYRADFTCGNTRSQRANWATFISQVTPP